jgi:hypothetical protein
MVYTVLDVSAYISHPQGESSTKDNNVNIGIYHREICRIYKFNFNNDIYTTHQLFT